MAEQTTPPPAGHNAPPDAIDEVIAAYADIIGEAENWLDGTEVTNKAQMKDVDDLRKHMRQARLDAERGQKSEAAPMHDAWKAALARWKPTIEDFRRIEAGLVALVGNYKQKLAAEKKAAERAAWDAAEKSRREAEAKAAAANAADLEAQREAAEAKQAALDAEIAAKAKSADKVKGMRAVKRYEIADHRAALHWIAANDREAITAFIEDYVRRNFKTTAIDGVTVTETKEAY